MEIILVFATSFLQPGENYFKWMQSILLATFLQEILAKNTVLLGNTKNAVTRAFLMNVMLLVVTTLRDLE